MPKPLPNNEMSGTVPPAGGTSGLEIGLSLVVTVLGLGALGFMIDRWLAWGPWGMMLGGFGGFGAWMVWAARRNTANHRAGDARNR